MRNDFPNSYYATHEGFAIGVFACSYLATRRCVVLEHLTGDRPPDVCAVTLFPWYEPGIHGFLRVVPTRNRIRRQEHIRMQKHADNLSWIGPTATLIAVNMRRAVGEMFKTEDIPRFLEALDQLCGYHRYTQRERSERRKSKRRTFRRLEQKADVWALA